MMLALSIFAKAADIQKLVTETQRLAQEPNEITLIWWIPTEFWATVLRDNKQVSEEQKEAFAKILNDYLVFAVVSADMGPMGGMTPKPRAKVIESTELRVGKTVVAPLNSSEISADMRNFVDMMKPMMANMLGQFGQGIEFLVYPNPAAGAPRVDATKSGFLAYTAFGHKYDWKLPLSCLLPPKFDVKTKQEFPGDYIFNPYSGERLSVK